MNQYGLFSLGYVCLSGLGFEENGFVEIKRLHERICMKLLRIMCFQHSSEGNRKILQFDSGLEKCVNFDFIQTMKSSLIFACTEYLGL